MATPSWSPTTTFPRSIDPDGKLKRADDWEPVGLTVPRGAFCLEPAHGVPRGDAVGASSPRAREPPGDAVLGQDADIVIMEQGMATRRVAEACIEAAKLGPVVAF